VDAPARAAVLLATGPLVAQTGDAGDPTVLVTWIAQLGLSAVFLWQWRDERGERRQTQASVLALTERAVTVLHDAAEALADVRAALTTQVDRVAALPDRKRDADIMLRRMELAAGELLDEIRKGRGGE